MSYIDEIGHNFFIQITDVLPHTGILSWTTPSRAVSWGKIDPDKRPDTVIEYLGSTLGMPILTSYLLAKRKLRKLKRLYDRCSSMLGKLKQDGDKHHFLH